MAANDLRKFVKSVLTGPGNVKSEMADALLTTEVMRMFEKAFVSKLTDSFDNYEMIEFTGDSFLKAYSAKFITTRFPMVQNPEWLTRLRQFYEKGSTLATIAHGEGFDRFVVVPPKMVRTLDNEPYRATLEDVFEAFIGTVVTAFDRVHPDGVGYAVGKNIAFHYYYKIDIELSRDFLWDPVSRLKEMYDRYWNSSTRLMYHTKYDERTKMYTVEVYGWLHMPKGTLKSAFTYQNAKLIASASDSSEFMAKNTAAKKALEIVLKDGWQEKVHHPSKRD